MTRFDDFLNDKPVDDANLQKLDGDYGCQICDKQTPVAYFNEKEGEIFWYCSEEHKSSIRLH